MMANTTGNPADDHIYIAIQRFLNREGDCLDRRAFREWLDLWSDDLHYRVTAQVNQDATSGTLEYPIIDEDAVGLKARIDQNDISHCLAPEQAPPSSTARLIPKKNEINQTIDHRRRTAAVNARMGSDGRKLSSWFRALSACRAYGVDDAAPTL